MLIIREEQLAVLRNAQEARFLRELMEHLRSQFPGETAALGDEPLLRRIGESVAKARTYGLSSEQELYRFLHLCVVQGWSFDEQPAGRWMRAMLADPRVQAPGQRLRNLYDECLRRLEVEAHNRRAAEAFAAPARGV